MMIKLALAFGMDCLFGDPLWLYHPIRVIGKWIASLENGSGDGFLPESGEKGPPDFV